MKDKVLVVAAHPDDEVLGCGGTVARLANDGCEVYTLILGTGIAARYGQADSQNVKSEIEKLKKRAHAANEIIGVKEVFFHNFADNRFDTVALLDLVKAIEQVKEDIKPDIVFTHYAGDLNIDHQITYKAVLTATRPLSEETVRQIYSFEVLSSTEWNYPLSFSPNVFFDISGVIEAKTKAMSQYKSELREFPHPRSLEGAKSNAKVWGMKAGLKYAEAFECVRWIR
jgi:LmbE family N-acetylglucosaminyl deacetylase